VNDPIAEISFRTMTAGDVATAPIGCQGDAATVSARIQDIGASAILAFDGEQHVGQLQFRRYAAATRSPNGIMDPLYWGDFGDNAPLLPHNTLNVFCYHVGQLDDTDQRDTRYQGHGIGSRLFDYLMEWAAQAGFEAVVAKATPSVRSVMTFMGGQSAEFYVDRGFEVSATWIDQQLRDIVREQQLVSHERELDDAARVSCCIRRL
jgi:GNAT superfamily N-acetyltransferase